MTENKWWCQHDFVKKVRVWLRLDFVKSGVWSRLIPLLSHGKQGTPDSLEHTIKEKKMKKKQPAKINHTHTNAT